MQLKAKNFKKWFFQDYYIAKLFLIKKIWSMKTWFYFYVLLCSFIQHLQKKLDRKTSRKFLKKFLKMTKNRIFWKKFRFFFFWNAVFEKSFSRKTLKTTWIAVINNPLHCIYLPDRFLACPKLAKMGKNPPFHI